MISGDYNDAIALLLLRTVTGILFFFQGYDKIFNIKIINVARTFNEPLNKYKVPMSILKPLIALSSYIELIGGFLLFFGFFRNTALLALSINMVFIAFFFSSIKPMWDMKYFFPRMLFLVLLLFLLPGQDYFCLDWFIW